MICDKNVANAVGGKTARACDSCIRKRARWYCPADDAFLCQVCDSSVHSANQLARRHERVRLKTASFKSSDAAVQNSVPSWHRGFTRKARTPRHGKPVNYQTPKSKEEPLRNPFPIVPEVGADEISHEENEEQLLYRVPIFDPFVAELCTPTTPKEAVAAVNSSPNGSETKVLLANCGHGVDNLHRFIPSDTDLAEFAADVESLLGKGLENECFGMEELGLIDCKEKVMKEGCLGSGRVKVEEEEGTESVTACLVDDSGIDMMREPFELSFDYDSPATCEEEDEKATVMRNIDGGGYEAEDKKNKKKILLRLDYEAVIAAWASQGSPWTNGDRPDFDPNECWPDCMVGVPFSSFYIYYISLIIHGKI